MSLVAVDGLSLKIQSFLKSAGVTYDDSACSQTQLLRYFEDQKPKNIARRQGIPVTTVRSRLDRALDILRSRLDNLHSGKRRAWCLLLAPVAGWKTAASPG